MKEYIKSAFNEVFGRCSAIDLIKRIVGVFIILFFLLICSGADSLSAEQVLLYLAVCVLMWIVLGISKAFRKE